MPTLSHGMTDRAQTNESLAVEQLLSGSERTVGAGRWDEAANRFVARKALLGNEALARRLHEARMLRRLDGVAGVPHLQASPPDAEPTLSAGGGSFLTGIAPLPPVRLVTLAARIAQILAEVHRHGVLHLDICPANILVDADGQPELVNFHLATVSSEEQRGFTHHNEIVGTLAYLAPEQTGRMGRAVDHRADLYALGATLYELAVGTPPFSDGDPLQLVRDHLVTIPVSPLALVPDLPPPLADIILRLLEKEPDCRYQSAEGLAHDLEQLQAMLSRGDSAPFILATRDFPPRLAAPSRLIGREVEIAMLREAFSQALTGRCRCVVVTGASGVGKSALVDQLRPVVAAHGGWFVTGKFDEFHQDGAATGILQAMRGLVTLLLAEPEPVLIELRARLLRTLGADADLVRAAMPEAVTLLGGAAPDLEGQNDIERRTGRAGIVFLRQIVSPVRPLIMALNDLQWAPLSSLRFLSAMLTAEPVPGLLIVAACRDHAPDGTHPYDTISRQWEKSGVAPRALRLENLTPAAVSVLVAEMLRLPPDAATQLAEAIGPHTGGNPFDTVELLNGLRRDGALTLGADGWRWDQAAIRRYVGQAEDLDLLAARISALPPATQEILIQIACLGGELTGPVLVAGSGLLPDALYEQVTPALEDGLLTVEHGRPGTEVILRFRHDRVKQSVYGRMNPATRKAHHIALARRLASSVELGAETAEQYLMGVEAIDTAGERLEVAGFFERAAERAQRIFHHASAERYLAAAIALRELVAASDKALLTRSRIAWLTVLCMLGRHEEADAVFAAIEQPDTDLLVLAEASCIQTLSLSSRGRHREALAAGLAMLARLGVCPTRTEGLPAAELDLSFAGLLPWVEADAAGDAIERVEIDDPKLRAVAKLLNRLLAPAGFVNRSIAVWLLLESQRLWVSFGVCPPLIANLGRVAIATLATANPFRINYHVARHAMAVGGARGYEPETSLARQSWAVFGLHWFEPLENAQGQAESAREGLLRYGELQGILFTYVGSLAAAFDTAPTLEFVAAEAASACEFAARTGNDQADAVFRGHQHMVSALTGEGDPTLSLLEAAPAVSQDDLIAGFGFHLSRALIAVLFDDAAALAHHTASVIPLRDRVGGAYRVALAYLLRGLSLARTLGDGGELTVELTDCRAWIAARAADAPCNFEHMLHLLDAEQAWAQGDFAAAVTAFDHALRCCSLRRRPWHHALIAERAGRFYLSRGLDYAGRALLVEARDRYADWGAVAVVRRLAAAHDFLQPGRPAGRSGGQRPASATAGAISSDGIDLLAILRASQALSSQTTIDGLRDRVAELLSAMTGATSVKVVLWYDQLDAWALPSDGDDRPVPLEEAAAMGQLPISAFRYALRMEAPLVVDDAVRHDRFAQDPHFAGMERCSLLVLPVRNQGKTRAVLVLENRLSRGVFSHARLDAVKLVAGQLAVSLDNAQLYASLEQRVAERTQALGVANRRLEALSISDALTGLSNRRCFDDVLRNEWARAARGQHTIAAVMIDVDHFKRYNDHYGHVAGDRCLRTVAAVLHASVRQGIDLAARYGGEEFVLVLPGTDLAEATSVAERVCAAIEALNEPHAASEFGHLTVSIGVAALPANDEIAAAELITAADAALYQAKQSGRNRVEQASTSNPTGPTA